MNSSNLNIDSNLYIDTVDLDLYYNELDYNQQYSHFNQQFNEIRNTNRNLTNYANLLFANQLNDMYNNLISNNNSNENTDFYNYENSQEAIDNNIEEINEYTPINNDTEEVNEYEVTSIYNPLNINIPPISGQTSQMVCPVCNNLITGSYSMHLLEYHRDVLVMASMFLQETDVEEYYNSLLNFTTNTLIDNMNIDNMNYEELLELCNNIGYHKPLNDITEIEKTFILKNKNDFINDTESKCVICLEKFENNTIEEIVETVKCKHLFCKPCFVNWMKDNKRCPICISDLL